MSATETCTDRITGGEGGSGVGVGVGVGAGVGVLVAVAVGVRVGVAVGVGVNVEVAVGVLVGVGVSAGVCVGVAMLVAVAVEVGVGLDDSVPSPPFPPDVAVSTAASVGVAVRANCTVGDPGLEVAAKPGEDPTLSPSPLPTTAQIPNNIPTNPSDPAAPATATVLRLHAELPILPGTGVVPSSTAANCPALEGRSSGFFFSSQPTIGRAAAGSGERSGCSRMCLSITSCCVSPSNTWRPVSIS
jgi:hypothetical protein